MLDRQDLDRFCNHLKDAVNRWYGHGPYGPTAAAPPRRAHPPEVVRAAAVRWLAFHGRTGHDTLAAVLGVTGGALRRALDACPWFAAGAGGVTLTPAGWASLHVTLD